MKHLFIISFVFITLSAKGQMLLANNTDKTIFDNINAPQLKTSYFKFQSTTTELREGNAINIPKAEIVITNTFKSDICKKQVFTRREGIPGEFITLLGPDGIEGFANVYTTNYNIGKFKFSCDYLYNDEGRLIIAEPCWQLGK